MIKSPTLLMTKLTKKSIISWTIYRLTLIEKAKTFLDVVIIWIIAMHNQSQDDTLDLLKDFLPDVLHSSSRLRMSLETSLSQTSKSSMLHVLKWSCRKYSIRRRRSFRKHWPLSSRNLSSWKPKRRMSLNRNSTSYNRATKKDKRFEWHKLKKNSCRNTLMIASWLTLLWSR